MEQVALASQSALREFKQTTSTMTTVDYDLNEIVIGIVDTLRTSKDFTARLEWFADLHSRHGDLIPTADGIILKSAIITLAISVNQLVRACKLYDHQDELRYRYNGMITDCIILTRT